MPGPFSFAAAGSILFGRGMAAQAAPRIAGFGRRVLLVRGGAVGFADDLAEALVAGGAALCVLRGTGEPDLDALDAAIAAGRAHRADVVVAIGGGAVIDLGKAAAALIPAAHPPLAYLETVGEGRTLDAAPLPFVALPTTAGTGAEVTKNAVIGVPAHRRKVSLRDDRMLARLAIVDPALTDGCPRGVTLASGLDAITQVIEPYLCARPNPLTDALCRDAIPRGLAALVRLMATGDFGARDHDACDHHARDDDARDDDARKNMARDDDARDDMALTSLFGGLALANAGLGAVHGLAGVIGGRSGAPHGAVCGRLLPGVLRANRAAVAAAGGALVRHDEVDGWLRAALGGTPEPVASGGWWDEDPVGAGRNGADLLEARIDAWGLPRLGAMGVDPEGVAADALLSSSMRANPVPLTVQTLDRILAGAL